MSSADRLQFDQVLVATGGRSIAHGEITKRLIVIKNIFVKKPSKIN
jgi:hypothetical protein